MTYGAFLIGMPSSARLLSDAEFVLLIWDVTFFSSSFIAVMFAFDCFGCFYS